MFGWLERLRGYGRAERKLLAWHAPGRPVWSQRDPSVYAREGYAKNAIAYRCVRLIAEAAASAPLKITPNDHPLAGVLAKPNPEQTGVELREAFFGHLQVSGNSYLEAAATDEDAPPSELYALRPDRMSVVPGVDGWPIGWEHRAGSVVRRFERDALTGAAPILHLKLFHPSDDWYARPYPEFPARRDVWSDGPAWRLGHWLNGRAGLATLADVVTDICARAGVTDADVSGLSGIVAGYVVDAPATARAALEPLMAAYAFDVREQGGVLVFAHTDETAEPFALSGGDLAAAGASDLFRGRADAAEAPIEARVRFLDAALDYRAGSASARRRDAAQGGVETVDAPLVLEPEAAEALAERLLSERRAEREGGRIALGPAQLALEPGDRVAFAGETYRVTRIEDAATRTLDLARVAQAAPEILVTPEPGAPAAPVHAVTPALSILDLPPLEGFESDTRPLAAVFASPWRGAHAIYAGADAAHATVRGVARDAAVMGELTWALWAGPVGRWDRGNAFRVKLYGGELESVSEADVLNGANVFAVEGDGGAWEILQARSCELVAPGEYELSGLLRGLKDSRHAMGAPVPVGRRFVKLDTRLARLTIAPHEWRTPRAFIAPPSGAPANDAAAESATLTLAHAGERPFRPVHLSAGRAPGADVTLRWIRQTRAGGLYWGPGEPPLGEPAERYSVEI